MEATVCAGIVLLHLIYYIVLLLFLLHSLATEYLAWGKNVDWVLLMTDFALTLY